jgi:four helix bundle protein
MWHYKRLEVWKRSRRLVVDIYDLTEAMPHEERYGLTAQMRRSANSIGANIAEGAGRSGVRDYANFLNYAIGSANETEHHLIVARDVKALKPDACADVLSEINEVRRMLHTLRRNLISGDLSPN